LIELYGRRTSINVQKVSWTLCELNLEFKWYEEHGVIGKVNVENYEQINPQLIVPTLNDNGSIISQSNSIVRHLYRKYSDFYNLTNVNEIAIADQWMEFQSTDLQINMTPVFWGLIRTAPEERNHDLINKNITLLNDKFIIFNNFLKNRKFMINDTFGMADIILAVATYRYTSLPIPHPKLSNLEEWYEQISSRDCFIKNIQGTFS
jgi:glutathione S-transferase